MEHVRALFAAFARRDRDAFLAHLHPDFELDVPATAERAGRGGPYRGHDGVREYFADVERIWSELHIEPEDIRAAGDSVMLFGRVRGRAGTEVVDARGMWTFRLDGDLLRSVRAFETD